MAHEEMLKKRYFADSLDDFQQHLADNAHVYYPTSWTNKNYPHKPRTNLTFAEDSVLHAALKADSLSDEREKAIKQYRFLRLYRTVTTDDYDIDLAKQYAKYYDSITTGDSNLFMKSKFNKVALREKFLEMNQQF